MAKIPTSVWVLGDQLSHEDNTALRQAPPDSRIVMIESLRVAQARPHSRMRLALIWSAMRHFAKELRRAGRLVDHIAVQPEPGPTDEHTFVDVLRDHIARHGIQRLLVMTPSDHSMSVYLRKAERHLGIPLEITPPGLFLWDQGPHFQRSGRAPSSPDAMARELRRRYHVLVDERGEPEGGQWHFEPEGQRPPTDHRPQLPSTEPDEITREVITLVERRFPDRVGHLNSFALPVTRRDALAWLEDFVVNRLPDWAKYQDSVRAGQRVISQGLLSPALNLGLIGPLEVVARAERAYQAGDVSLQAAAGFMRGVMGWREQVHAIHWSHIHAPCSSNFLDAHRPLPNFFWSGETACECLRDVLRRALDTGHASHTERLMILGNYLLMIGADPQEACAWFSSVFIDAWEWSALPNTLGVALWATGDLMVPKPYAASANYISKISDHCARCPLDHTRREGDDACPFNYLYWSFVDRHRKRLAGVPRMSRALEFLAARDTRDLAMCRRQTERHLREIGLE